MLAQGTRADILHFLAHRHQCRMKLFDCQYLALRVLDCAHLTYTYRHTHMNRFKQAYATTPPHTNARGRYCDDFSLPQSIYALLCTRAQNTYELLCKRARAHTLLHKRIVVCTFSVLLETSWSALSSLAVCSLADTFSLAVATRPPSTSSSLQHPYVK